MIRTMIFTAALALAGVVQTEQILAQDAESVAAFRDWTVFNPPGDPKECFIVSPPTSTKARRGNQDVTSTVKRSDIRLFVTIRPSQGVDREISYTSGYPLAPDSTVDVRIGSGSFALNVGTDDTDEWAWPPSKDKDAEIVAAMRRGSAATLVARSARGTVTTDEFSLLGFSAALEKAQELCN